VAIDLEVLKQLVPLSSVSDLRPNGGGQECPCCGKKNLSTWGDSSYKCWTPGCDLGEPGDVIKFIMTSQGFSFKQTITDLAGRAGIAAQDDSLKKRSAILSQVLRHYQNFLWDDQEGAGARDYLAGRGFSLEVLKFLGVGYAPPYDTLMHCGLSVTDLQKQGLRSFHDYYLNRVIIPIRNYNGRLVHLTGRYLGPPPEDEPKTKDTREVDGLGGTKDYLFMEDRLKTYKDSLLVITEGSPDALSAVEAGFPAVGLLGLTGLVNHSWKFSRFKKILLAFDNDRFEDDHPVYPRQLKSWGVVLPQAMNLQIILPHTEICIWKPPEGSDPPVKDVNDYLINRGTASLREAFSTAESSLITACIRRYGPDISCHMQLLRLIAATGQGASTLAEYIPYNTPIEYGLAMCSDGSG